MTESASTLSPNSHAPAGPSSAPVAATPPALPNGCAGTLKILHILDHTLPLHSGYTFRTQNILDEQRKRGWSPVALTSSKHEASWKGPSSPLEEFDGIRYYRTGKLGASSLPFAGELALMRRLASRIEEVAAIEKPHLLHAHSPVLNALPALWVGRKLRIPVVYEIRAFWEDAAVDHQSYAEGSWKYRLTRSLETWACRRASQIGILCNGLKNDLVQRGIPAEKITVVWNGVNPDDFRAGAPDLALAQAHGLAGKKVLGYIGSFYRYEGLELLVEAMAKISASRSDVALLLAGGGETEKPLREQIARLQLADKVIIPGRIPHDRIPGVYSLIDVLVYPRHSMRLTDLVTPLKPLEAMAMGRPLVASNVGGHLELIRDGETGLLFPAGDASALAVVLEKVLDDPALQRHLAQRGAEWVRQNHSWEKTTSVYTSIYSRALGSGNML